MATALVGKGRMETGRTLTGYRHLKLDETDRELAEALGACIEAQRDAVEEQGIGFRADAHALDRVSGEELEAVLGRGDDVSDVRTEAGLSNCLVFNTGGLPGSVLNDGVLALRARADGLIVERLRRLLEEPALSASSSGHFWYPPGSYMGWHTNARVPGWRAYVTWVEHPGRSFFRYRDPATHDIVTSWDQGCELRTFPIDPARPLWHAVYSDTNRYSFGYRITLAPTAATPATAHDPTSSRPGGP